jgi:hypothetical protein
VRTVSFLEIRSLRLETEPLINKSACRLGLLLTIPRPSLHFHALAPFVLAVMLEPERLQFRVESGMMSSGASGQKPS